MSRTLTNKFLMVIALLGVFVASVLTIQHFKPGIGGLCKAGLNSCEGVLKSQYGAVPILPNLKIPTAILGLGMYLTFLYLGRERGKLLNRQGKLEAERAQAYAEGEENPTDAGLRPQIYKLDQFLWILAAAAFGISWYLQYASLYIIMAFCPWCLSSALLVTLLFILTSYDFHFAGKEATGEKKMLAGIMVFIGALLLFMNAPEIIARYRAIQMGYVERKITPSEVNHKELIAKTRWWKGEKNAPVTMIEFADYMCPQCKGVHENIKKYMEELRPGSVRLGFYNFPIPIPTHKWSRKAAEAAEAAGQQGKFWEMHDALFDHQDDMKLPSFTENSFNQIAEEAGLDMTKFRKDFANPRMAEIVRGDEMLGAMNKVDSTPTSFLIKGDLVIPCIGVEPLQQVMMNRNHPIWKAK